MKPRRSRPRSNPSYTGNTVPAAWLPVLLRGTTLQLQSWGTLGPIFRVNLLHDDGRGYGGLVGLMVVCNAAALPVPLSHLAVNFKIRNCVKLCNPIRCNSEVTRINTDSLVKRGTFSLKFKIYPRQYRNIKTLAIRLDTAQARTI